MRYLGVDPGETTGLFQLDIYDPKPDSESYFFTPRQVTSLVELFKTLHSIAPDMIICEDFDRRMKPGNIVPIIKGIGIVELYQEMIGIPVELQSASYGKGFWDNGKMKRVNMHFPGKDGKHATDAARHVLQYLSNKGNDKRFIMMLKPEDFTA